MWFWEPFVGFVKVIGLFLALEKSNVSTNINRKGGGRGGVGGGEEKGREEEGLWCFYVRINLQVKVLGILARALSIDGIL